MTDPVDPAVPFRWDLITPDRLGSLLAGTQEPSLWFLPELVQCSGKVLARCAGGDLVFVGRSLDSMFDLLGGALAGLTPSQGPQRFPISFARAGEWSGRTWQRRALERPEIDRAREVLAGLGLAPESLARRTRPVNFVDVVHEGGTFTDLYELLRDWVEERRAPWPVIRSKVRFIGITSQKKTSPNTFRWQQRTAWTRDLPRRSVVNVSLHPFVWSYFGDQQVKLTRSFSPEKWLADPLGPQHDDHTRQALAEAVALVAHGRSGDGRRALARAIAGEPSLSESWLRSLVGQLNG